MSTPESSSGHSGPQNDRPDDQHDQRLEPIDPTLTFDAYFEKNATASPNENESPATANDFDQLPAEPTDSEPERFEPAHSESSHSESTSSESTYAEPAYAEPNYSTPSYSEPTYSEPT